MSIILITALALIWLTSVKPEPPHDRAADGERYGLDYRARDALAAAGLVADLVTVERSGLCRHQELTPDKRFCKRHGVALGFTAKIPPRQYPLGVPAVHRLFNADATARQLISCTFYRALPRISKGVIT
jgi:hypothetical protein